MSDRITARIAEVDFGEDATITGISKDALDSTHPLPIEEIRQIRGGSFLVKWGGDGVCGGLIGLDIELERPPSMSRRCICDDKS